MNALVRVIGSFFMDIIETVVVALSVFLIVYLFLMQPHQVNGESMVPNFQDKDYLLTDKLSYRFRDPLRGEVVVFHAPSEAGCPQGTGCDFVKRIIATPGETVEVKEGKVFVNGLALDEKYLPSSESTQPGVYTSNGLVTMGSDQYFVSGDNRSHSSDSRTWGPITKDDIVGRVFFRYWPPGSLGMIKAGM